MIEIIKTEQYYNNARRTGEYTPCCICGKGVKNPRYYLHLTIFWEAMTAEEAQTIGVGQDQGEFLVGPDCLRQHPELKEYVHEYRK